MLALLELSTLMVLFLTMWGGVMIFASTEANDMVSVEYLTVFVVFDDGRIFILKFVMNYLPRKV